MQRFEKWLKDKRNVEMPKGDMDAGWFFEHDLPMIVECTCCQMTMALPNAFIDNDGHTYCSSCADYDHWGVDEENSPNGNDLEPLIEYDGDYKAYGED